MAFFVPHFTKSSFVLINKTSARSGLLKPNLKLFKEDKKGTGYTIEIELETQMYTKPVLYGVSPSSDLQNYALTTFTYEDSYASTMYGNS